jgi:hypothetical protein
VAFRPPVLLQNSIEVIRTVHATLLAGDYTQALDAGSEMSWRFAADGIANQVDRWVRSNSARLIANRAADGNAAPQPPPQNARDAGPPPPPDSPAAPSEASIEHGMTTAQVLKALGEPQKKVNYGQKSLWTYKGMQVVFDGGKVTDVKF